MERVTGVTIREKTTLGHPGYTVSKTMSGEINPTIFGISKSRAETLVGLTNMELITI
jgi:hypothetical protein